MWFWNLSDPNWDPDYERTDAQQKAWVRDHIFANGTKATDDQFRTYLGSVTSSGRTFHPKNGGHRVIKDRLIQMLRADKVPSVKQREPLPPPPTKPPYALGETHIHVNEYWGCLDDANKLSVEITRWDSSNKKIGYLHRTQAGASASASMKSKFENTLVITSELARGGYIQFALGGLQFDTISNLVKTDDEAKKARDSKKLYCFVGGYDPKEGPKCWIRVGRTVVADPKAVRISLPFLPLSSFILTLNSLTGKVADLSTGLL